jgi:hypothetical protein
VRRRELLKCRTHGTCLITQRNIAAVSKRNFNMAKLNREHAIVLGGLALGILVAGSALVPYGPAGADTPAASPLLTLRSEAVSAFECKKGPDGIYDWDIAEPKTKLLPGASVVRSAANIPARDFSPRDGGSARIKQDRIAEQALIQRDAEKVLETQVCDAGKATNHHG